MATDLSANAMRSAPLVAVLMPVFNGEAFLGEAIESILNQSFRDFEFIIINDGSTDRTSSILHRFELADHRVRVYHQENRGLIASLNRGCRLARGKYIARMDADDVAFPYRFERQVDFLEQNPRVGLVGGAVEVINCGGVPIHRLSYPVQDQKIKDTLSSYNCFAHSTIVMRTEAFRVLNGYRRAFLFAEDYDLWLRMAERYELANLPESVLQYRVHIDQVCLRNIKQQVISTLGAQVVAKIRRETGHDPMWQVERVTPDILGEPVVNSEIIHYAVIEGYLWWADLMLKAGVEEIALQLLNEASACSQSKVIQRRIAAKVHQAYARTYYKQGRLFQGMLAMMMRVLCSLSCSWRSAGFRKIDACEHK